MLLHPFSENNEEELIASRIESKINELFKYKNQVLSLGVSMGAANYPRDGVALDELIEVDDKRMYCVKTRRKLIHA